MDVKDDENPEIQKEKPRALRQIMGSLHFSGKVIIGSVLFGFGLVLVGAILLVIATGGQKRPPLQMTLNEKPSTLGYVGPGVMGIGGFLIVVGTTMCLIETIVLRPRRLTEARLLADAENTDTTSELIQASTRNKNTTSKQQKSVNKRSLDVSKSTEFTTSKAERETNLEVEVHTDESLNQVCDNAEQNLTTSIYVDAEDEIGQKDEIIHGSTEFKTPPEIDLLNANYHRENDLNQFKTPPDQQLNYSNQTSPEVNAQYSGISDSLEDQLGYDSTRLKTSPEPNEMNPEALLLQIEQPGGNSAQVKASAEFNIPETEISEGRKNDHGDDLTRAKTPPDVNILSSEVLDWSSDCHMDTTSEISPGHS